MVSSENNNPSTSARSIACHYQNKYEKWYWSLIDKFEKRDYLPEVYDKHHPVPKEVWPEGWRHKETQLTVCVTYREHFILHLLLCKCGLSWNSLTRFVHRFVRGEQRKSQFSNLSNFWKKAHNKRVTPHNKGKKGLPYVTEEYRISVGNGGRGKLNNPSLVCKPWRNNRFTPESLEIWKMADYLHYVYQFIPKKKGCNGSDRLAKAVGVSPSQALSNVVNAFNGNLKSLCPGGENWVPDEDVDWKNFAML